MEPTTFLWIIASLVLSIALAPKPTRPTAATLDDFEFPTPDEGTPQIVVFGDVWISGWTVINYGHLRTVAIEKDDGAKL